FRKNRNFLPSKRSDGKKCPGANRKARKSGKTITGRRARTTERNCPIFHFRASKRKARKSKEGFPPSFRRSEITAERNQTEISFRQKREEMNSVELQGGYFGKRRIFPK